MGENLMVTSKGVYPAYRENTIGSFQKAASSGADFVEFDVQVTRDGVPVIWHDDQVVHGNPASPASPEVKDLTVSELQGLWRPTCSLLRRFRDFASHEWHSGVEAWVCEHEEPAPLLAAVFDALPEHVGFDIEVKMSNPPEVHTPAGEIERMLSAILPVVAAHARGRRVFYSSFDPDVCLELKKRQSAHPVYYLSGCGLYAHPDPRRTSTPAAISFASESGMSGIVVPASVLLQVMTYGLENNDLAALARQRNAGVAAAIVDEVEGVLPKAKQQVLAQ